MDRYYQERVEKAADDALQQIRNQSTEARVAIWQAAKEYDVLVKDVARHLRSRRR